MPKLQQSHDNPRQNTVTIPQAIIKELGWEKGDLLLVFCDKKADSITMRRAKDED